MYKLIDYLKNRDGVTMIEYGLIAAMIAIAVVVVLGTVGDSLNTVFNTISTSV